MRRRRRSRVRAAQRDPPITRIRANVGGEKINQSTTAAVTRVMPAESTLYYYYYNNFETGKMITYLLTSRYFSGKRIVIVWNDDVI